MIYDRTCTGLKGRGLTEVWWAGALVYGGLGRFDGWRGVASWGEALEWLGTFTGRAGPDARIAEVQYWGHGNWGCARIGAESLDHASLEAGHPHRAGLLKVRERLAPEALWWFRTCDTFGARRGHRFAVELTHLLGCDTAGHTHIIGPWQSGLHRLRPRQAPHWPEAEGLAAGTPEQPARSTWSTPFAPNTITFLHNRVPTGW
ncbi:MAG: hypothetical protein R3F59_16290 [Myxococcota bacterium]